eukprot:6140382-Amphidinium_carterae.1
MSSHIRLNPTSLGGLWGFAEGIWGSTSLGLKLRCLSKSLLAQFTQSLWKASPYHPTYHSHNHEASFVVTVEDDCFRSRGTVQLLAIAS